VLFSGSKLGLDEEGHNRDDTRTELFVIKPEAASPGNAPPWQRDHGKCPRGCVDDVAERGKRGGVEMINLYRGQTPEPFQHLLDTHDMFANEASM
jgi:hypothetical protein